MAEREKFLQSERRRDGYSEEDAYFDQLDRELIAERRARMSVAPETEPAAPPESEEPPSGPVKTVLLRIWKRLTRSDTSWRI